MRECVSDLVAASNYCKLQLVRDCRRINDGDNRTLFP